jgi:pantoate--beta-alanine ligase
VVHRLLNIVNPNNLYLGQKDYQQCMVIKKLMELIESPAKLIIGHTLRETSGLAMSSRNMRLSATDKQKAVAIFTAHTFIKQHLSQGDLQPLINDAKQKLTAAGFEKIDYVAICNANTLQPVINWDGSEPLVVLTAAFLNGIRLIDNMLLTN